MKIFRRGWCLGTEEFREKMLELMEGKLGENHSSELHRETSEQKAERIIAEELGPLRWSEAELLQRMKNDPGKLAIAARLRSQTTLPVKWIAARLQMGTYKSAKVMINKAMQAHEHSNVARAGTDSGIQLQFQPTV